MRLVIDTNLLRTPELESYLATSPRHLAVLPEHTMAEIFKPALIEGILDNLEVLERFPTQVLVLKGNRSIVDVDPRVPGMANRLIDRASTRATPAFYAAVRKARSGHEGYQRMLWQRHLWAIERVRTAEANFADQAVTLAELKRQIGPDDLRRLAAGLPTSNAFKGQLLSTVTELARQMLRNRFDRVLSDPPARFNEFVWRYVLAHLVRAINLTSQGAREQSAKNATNDHFDNVFVTFATYFDGLLSADKGPLETHVIVRSILQALGARLTATLQEGAFADMAT